MTPTVISAGSALTSCVLHVAPQSG